MITTPAIFESTVIFEERNDPIHVAVAPSKIKTNENPAINRIELSSSAFFSLLSRAKPLFPSLISENETPDINEKYPGTSGRTQGDKKEIIPAAKAIYRETSGIFY